MTKLKDLSSPKSEKQKFVEQEDENVLDESFKSAIFKFFRTIDPTEEITFHHCNTALDTAEDLKAKIEDLNLMSQLKHFPLAKLLALCIYYEKRQQIFESSDQEIGSYDFERWADVKPLMLRYANFGCQSFAYKLLSDSLVELEKLLKKLEIPIDECEWEDRGLKEDGYIETNKESEESYECTTYQKKEGNDTFEAKEYKLFYPLLKTPFYYTSEYSISG